MGRFTTLIGALVLVVAACAGTASPTPTRVPATATPVAVSPAAVSSAASPVPPAATPAWATPAPVETIAVKVTFDGKKCTYAGPTVVPAGSMLEWTLDNTPAELTGASGAALIVLPVVDGTTWEQVLADTRTLKSTDVPTWSVIPGAGSDGLDEVKLMTPDAAKVGGTLWTQMTRSAYYVGCNMGPTQTNTPYPALLLKVMKG